MRLKGGSHRHSVEFKAGAEGVEKAGYESALAKLGPADPNYPALALSHSAFLCTIIAKKQEGRDFAEKSRTAACLFHELEPGQRVQAVSVLCALAQNGAIWNRGRKGFSRILEGSPVLADALKLIKSDTVKSKNH
jgi:hypothetical protein